MNARLPQLSAHEPSRRSEPKARFNLTRWFAAVALVAISLISATAGVLLNWFLTERLLLQEAQLTHEFVQSMVAVEKSLQTYFHDTSRGMTAEAEVAFTHIAAMPDVLRTNVYDRQRNIIWSSDRQLIGRIFGTNKELERALNGEVVVHTEENAPPVSRKDEHQDLKRPRPQFVEIYVPVRDASGRVFSVMEFYKNPRALLTALSELRSYIAAGAAASGVLLFLALFGLVRRADRTIRRQQRQLVETETLAAIGEMSSAVAHGIRNPLASIRSSAELMQEGDPTLAHDAARDIVDQSDRLEAWVSELLSYTRPLDEPPSPVLLPALVTRCLADFEHEMHRRRIAGGAVLSNDLPPVRGDALLLAQVLRGLLANAIEALDHDGRITVRGAWDNRRECVVLGVEDSGVGMTPEQLQRAGKPFFTTKPRGLGVGLALARRVIERFGGRLEIDSAVGRGTAVRLHMRPA